MPVVSDGTGSRALVVQGRDQQKRQRRPDGSPSNELQTNEACCAGKASKRRKGGEGEEARRRTGLAGEGGLVLFVGRDIMRRKPMRRTIKH
jgi:hypothetical protein